MEKNVMSEEDKFGLLMGAFMITLVILFAVLSYMQGTGMI